MDATRVETSIRAYLAAHPRLKDLAKTARFLPLAVSDAVWRRRNRKALTSLNTQSTPTLTLNLTQGLLVGHSNRQLRVARGSNAIYLPLDDSDRKTVGFPSNYPNTAGIKILLDMRPPQEARYLHPSKTSTTRLSALGNLRDNLVAASYLYAAGMGPRVWDLVAVSTADGAVGSAFVIDHVEAQRDPTDADIEEFLATLDAHLARGVLSVTYPGWRTTADFTRPDCNRNLIVGASGPLYVDFQNFRVDQKAWLISLAESNAQISHFGDSRRGRPSTYLYQSIPGLDESAKRNVARRWRRLTAALSESHISVDGRVVLDVGTNIGMILHYALANGARWALGWDQPGVARAAESILLALGDTRFDIAGANLSPLHSLSQDVRSELLPMLDESVVFYLSVHRHIGFVEELSAQTWRALVYEGHDGESVAEARHNVERLVGPGIALGSIRVAVDGDSGPRPYCVAVRTT
jgi:hypothetical protein